MTDAERLEACLSSDGVALIPTDTVYGLACNPESEVALRRVYELKRRPPRKPAAIMFFSLTLALKALPELGQRTRAAIEALLPGAITVLISNSERRYPLACAPVGDGVPTGKGAPAGEGAAVEQGVSVGDGAPSAAPLLGLRVPALPSALALLQGVRMPVAQSSANFSGGNDPRCLADVPAELREGVDLALDGGTLPGSASTVLDLSAYERDGSWRIVRAGPVGTAQIACLLD